MYFALSPLIERIKRSKEKQRQNYNSTILPKDQANSPILCQNIIHSNLDHLDITENIMPFLYIDDIILIANAVNALERYIMLEDAVKTL